jgi:hypothetical protein
MNIDPALAQAKSAWSGLLILVLVLLLVIVGIVVRSKAPSGHPLVPAKRLVVLLVPGASLDDLTDIQGNGNTGVFPNRLPWRGGTEKLTTMNPATSADLIRACQQLGGKPLKTALSGAGVLTKPLGNDPAARAFLGAMVIPSNTEAAWHSNRPAAVGGFIADPLLLAKAIHQEVDKSATEPLLLTAVFDDLFRCDTYAPLTRPEAAVTQRRAALRRLDALCTRLTGSGNDALPPDTAFVIASPIPSMAAAERGEMLGPILIWHQPSLTEGLLTSPSTRQTPGLLAADDLSATLLSLLGISGTNTVGRSATIVEMSDSDRGLPYLAGRVSHWAAQYREIRLLVTLPWLLAGALIIAAFFSRGRWRYACVVGAVSAPLVLILAALFASPNPGQEALVYVVAGSIIVLIAVASAVFTTRHPKGERIILGAVYLGTAALILIDTLTGGTLLARSPLSYSPIVAARYYGIGNEISGVYLGTSVLAVGILSPTPLGVVIGGITAALISGLPLFGADAGGFVAALIGFGAMFVLLNIARSDNKRQATLRAGSGAGIVVLLLLFFYILGNGQQSAGQRSHVGEAVASAENRGVSKALFPIIQRKAATGIRLLATSPWSILLITEMGICIWFWRRRSKADAVSQAIYKAAFVSAGALLLVNDSGVVASATCLLFPTSLLLSEVTTIPPPSTG